MATSIPAGTPPAQQFRKQIADEHGNFRPVPDEPQTTAPSEPTEPPFEIGDAVSLTGRVLEVHHPQGGQISLKVQTPQGAGWFQGQHLERAEPVDDGKDAQIEELSVKVALLTGEVDRLKSKAAADAQRHAAELAEAKKPAVTVPSVGKK